MDFICIFTLFFLLLIPLLINSLGIFSVPFHDNIIADSSAWLGFLGSYSGSIIGGVLTLAGVLLTLNFTQKQLKEDKRLSVIPFLNFSLKHVPIEDTHNYFRDTEVIFLISMINTNEYKVRSLLEIENIGLGAAIDIVIPKIWTLDSSIVYKYNVKNNETKNFYIEIYNEDFLTTNKEICFDIYYKDLLGNEYKQEITLDICIVYGGKKPEGYFYEFFLRGFSSPSLI